MVILATLLASLLATAAPRAPVEDEWGVVNTPALSVSARVALAALESTAAAPFRVLAATNGVARSLHGGAWDPGTTDPAEAALRFLRSYGSLFGIPFGESWLDLHASVVVRGSAPMRAYVSFLLNGVPLEGSELVMMLDEQVRIVGATGFGPERFLPLPTFALSEQQVASTALASVRAATRHGAPVDWRAPEVERTYLVTPEGVHAAYRFALTDSTGAHAYHVYVAADSGLELQRIDRIHHGGKWPHNGGFIGFDTTTAHGRVYADQADALAGIASAQALTAWSTGVPKPVKIPKGFLIGARAAMFNAAGPDVFKTNGAFYFNPVGEPDRFDQVNTYHSIESFYGHLTAALGTALGSDFSLPVMVNLKTPVVNAYFSPGLFPPTLHTEGYIVLHDMSEGRGPEADISRDPTVVHHEYTHAWVYFEGEDFRGDLDYPTRAVGEAVADFYSLAFNKDGAIGRYTGLVALGAPYMRNLRDDDHFPETVVDAMGLTVSGLPEEHRSGEVMGALLLDLRSTSGAKAVERLVFEALPLMPDTMGPVGYPDVTPENALEATGVYFGTCVLALLSASNTAADAGEILGAATGRGVLGDTASEVQVFMKLEQIPDRKAVLPSRFVVPSQQSYFFKANPGRLLRVKIVGDPAGSLQPDFVILGANGEPEPTGTGNLKQFSLDGKTVEQTGLELLLPKGSLYEIQITTQLGTSGEYTLTLDA